jgi:hypothetical protein
MSDDELSTRVRRPCVFADDKAIYEGVSMRELLARVGVPFGNGLRGRELAAAVIVTGADGYKTDSGTGARASAESPSAHVAQK